MSDYSQITYFTPKDSLSTGNPNKIIYGSDMDAELSAISTAIATKADVDGDAIGAGTPATELSVDNLKLDANKIFSTNTDGDIELEPNGTGTVVITNVDVAAGEIDGTAIGANSASTGAFTTLTASGDVNFDGGTFFVDASADAVGIGTTSPAAKLEILDGNGIGLRFGDVAAAPSLQTAGYIGMSTSAFSGNNGDLVLYPRTSAASNILLMGGNVGIGTSSPVAKLHLNSASTTAIVFDSDTSTQQYELGIGYGGVGTSSFYLYDNTASAARFVIDSSGNLLLAGTGTPTSSAGNLVLYNGTAPTGNATNGVILYAEDVSASSELKVRDEAGNVTTLSPHNFDLIPEGPSEDMAWSYYSERDGKRINVDMLKAIRVLEQLSGEKLVHMV